MTIAADTSFYMDSVSLTYGQTCNLTTEKITISPNPVTDKLTVVIATTSAATAAIIIYSAAGQRMYTTTQQVSGSQTITIPMKQMSKGVYYVTVLINNKKTAVKKIIRN